MSFNLDFDPMSAPATWENIAKYSEIVNSVPHGFFRIVDRGADGQSLIVLLSPNAQGHSQQVTISRIERPGLDNDEWLIIESPFALLDDPGKDSLFFAMAQVLAADDFHKPVALALTQIDSGYIACVRWAIPPGAIDCVRFGSMIIEGRIMGRCLTDQFTDDKGG